MIGNCDFTSFVDYETRETYSCESSGCHEEGICRCSIIEEVIIKSINLTELSEEVFFRIDEDKISVNRNKKLSQILWDYDYEVINQYCVDRILTINKLWKPENWFPKISMSYYGEEIEDIKIDDILFEKIMFQIERVIEYNTLEEKIFYLLELEYGKVLDTLIGKKMYVEVVEFDKILFNHKSHSEKVKNKDLVFYTDYDFIKGVVRKKNLNYFIIDGYHRLTANQDKKVTVIVVN